MRDHFRAASVERIENTLFIVGGSCSTEGLHLKRIYLIEIRFHKLRVGGQAFGSHWGLSDFLHAALSVRAN